MTAKTQHHSPIPTSVHTTTYGSIETNNTSNDTFHDSKGNGNNNNNPIDIDNNNDNNNTIERETLQKENDTNKSCLSWRLAFPYLVILLLLLLLIVAGGFLSSKLSLFQESQSGHTTTASTTTFSTIDSTTDTIPESKIAFHYEEQLVDHFNTPGLNATATNAIWSQKYFVSSKYFAGPGNPIFVIIGGEGPLTQILYPFVSEHLAKRFNAFVLQPEHRFYGTSQPLGHQVKHNHDLVGYLSPEQAMADVIRLLKHKQHVLHCSQDRSSPHYCPVITVGGSYPGFLSAMLRLVYPNVIDIAYASSAPLHLYAQQVHSADYYEFVTEIAEKASKGCAAATKSGLHEISTLIGTSNIPFTDMAELMGICRHTIPGYIQTTPVFRQEIMMVISSSYADFNMGFYPPNDNTTQLMMACKVFQNEETTIYEKIKTILTIIGGGEDEETEGSTLKQGECFDMMTFVPSGAHATISSSDWSGAGSGNTARSWEYQLCSDLIVRTGFSRKSMFPPREWTLEWVTAHCQHRFGIVPQPYRLVDLWGFDDLVKMGASRILFTNGLNDGWSISSILEDLSDSLVTINFPNGAHHSDLSHEGPNDKDTEDIQAGYIQIANRLGQWLEEMKIQN